MNFCEFDKYATQAYCSIHGVDESLNLGDITKVNETEIADFNMMTWGFPCTDISVAGNQKGFLDENGEKTRSGMYYEGIRILREKLPSLSIIENVKNLTGKKFKKEFEMVLSDLDESGYNSYWKVLNAKDYGIPQNRERVFIISIRKELDNGLFEFPEPFDNGIRLKDILEDEVDEKYYISEDKVKRFLTNLNNKDSLLYDACQVKREGKSREYNDYSPTLTARDYKDPRLVNVNQVKHLGNIVDTGNWNNPQRGKIYSPDGCSPSLNTCGSGGLEPKIVTAIISNQGESFDKETKYANTLLARDYKGFGNQGMNAVIKIPQATKKGYITCELGGVADLSYPNSRTRRGRVQEDGNISPTITATETGICKIESAIRIRKLIPLETFRLMGFSDEAFFKAMIGLNDLAVEFISEHPYLIGKTILDEATTIQGISNSQLYKMSGNSIVVDVLYYIMVELYKAMPYLFDDLRLSSFFSGVGAFECSLDRLYESINTGNFTRPQVE